MLKFECIRCGECCKFSYEKAPFKGPSFITETTLVASPPSLAIFDFEKDIFLEKDIVPHHLYYDKKNGQFIILTYSIKGEECPNLVNNMCSIYDKRPVLCRAFPCNSMGEDFIFVPKCAGEIKHDELCKELAFGGSKEELLKNLSKRYGHSFDNRILISKINKFYALKLNELERIGKIKIARRKEGIEFIMKKIESANFIDASILIEEHLKINVKNIFQVK